MISTLTNNPSITDVQVSEIPPGTYTIAIEGLDIINLMAINPPFPLRGEVFPDEEIEVAAVPTLSEWGLTTVFLGLGLIGLFALRKRNLVRIQEK